MSKFGDVKLVGREKLESRVDKGDVREKKKRGTKKKKKHVRNGMLFYPVAYFFYEKV